MSHKHKTPAETQMGGRESEELLVVCPHCFTRNSVRQHFCRRCGTPLTGLAVTDPLGQVYSEGDAFRKAIDKPYRPMILIGMWLILGPTFFACIFLVGWFTVGAFTGPFGPVTGETLFAIILFPLFIGGVGSITGIMLFRTTRNFIRLRRKMAEHDRHRSRSG